VKRVYVTGGNGFMGSQIVRALMLRGYEVTALVGADQGRENLEGLDVDTRSLDLLDPRSVASALEGGQWLVHNAACYSFWEPDPWHIYRVNVEGTQSVAAAARTLGYERIVHTSSTATLMPSINQEIESEESLFDVRRFRGHYKSSKLIAEIAFLREVARGLPGMIVHPTTVIGARDRRPTPSGTMVVHFLNGIMKAYARTVLNVVDVEDVAMGHVLALERGRIGHQYVLGSENLSMREITAILSELTGLPAPKIELPPRLLLVLGRIGELVANHVTHRPPLIDVEATLHAADARPSSSDKAVKELGYAPSPGRLALAKAISWFIENGYCNERNARRVRDHGALDQLFSGRSDALGVGA
jgi:dihydroflavonol-4-reductase